MRADIAQLRLTIEVSFDFICPWCWIGRRHLAEALRRFRLTTADFGTQAIWHGVQLLPDMPAEGLPYQAFYERRLGNQAAVAARRQQVADAGRMAGLEFRFDTIRTMPNTALAHALTRQLQSRDDPQLVDSLIERLFAAYFVEGADIGDANVLCQIGASLGGDRAELQRILAAPPAAQEYRVTPGGGVPYFVFDGRLSIAGAQPPDTLLGLLQRSAARLAEPQGIA